MLITQRTVNQKMKLTVYSHICLEILGISCIPHFRDQIVKSFVIVCGQVGDGIKIALPSIKLRVNSRISLSKTETLVT